MVLPPTWNKEEVKKGAKRDAKNDADPNKFKYTCIYICGMGVKPFPFSVTLILLSDGFFFWVFFVMPLISPVNAEK